MAIIHLQKQDFTRGGNNKVLPYLKKTKISEEDYNQFIEPFLDSLQGFHSATGPQLKNLLLLPKLKFWVNGVSLSGVLNYISGKKNQLEVPIQDRYSIRIENTKYDINPNLDDDYRIKKGIVPQMYQKQTGKILFSKDKKRKITLDDIADKEIWIPTATLSEEAIDEILMKRS